MTTKDKKSDVAGSTSDAASGETSKTQDEKPAQADSEKAAKDAADEKSATAGQVEQEEAEGEQEAEPVDELAQAKAEAAEAQDRLLRLQAEWTNFRKRNAAERAEERSRACERLVTNLLPVVDDLERALDHAADSDLESFVEGVGNVRTKFVDVLGKEQVSVIDPVGEAFDVTKHQAVSKRDDDSVPDETVVEVFQKGYEMAGKVLRPAMVVVSTGGPVREKEPAKDQDDGQEEE
jgi:molecular chaperone GrpE